jgi:hypothetical protein
MGCFGLAVDEKASNLSGSPSSTPNEGLRMKKTYETPVLTKRATVQAIAAAPGSFVPPT